MYPVESSRSRCTPTLPGYLAGARKAGGIVMLALSACAVDGLESPGGSFADDGPIELTLVRDIGADTVGIAGPDGGARAIGFAAAVASAGGYVYVIDSAEQALLRADPTGGGLHLVRQLADARSRGLYVTGDQIIYLVDERAAEVLQLDESGQIRRRLHDDRLLPAPLDVTEANWGAVVVVADALTDELIVFDTFFGPARVIGGSLIAARRAGSITAIAGADDSVYALDAIQREVLRFDLSGRLMATYGEDDLHAPVALAVDDCGRIVVADGHPDGLYVVDAGLFGTAERVPYGWTLSEPITDLWFDRSELYIAAGTSGVRVLRMEPICGR